MIKDRDQLQIELNRLLLQVPRLLRDSPDPADFWPAFAGLADPILEAAGPDDCDWAGEGISAILRRYNLAPEG